MPRPSRLILPWCAVALAALVIAILQTGSFATPVITLSLSGIQRLHWASVTCSDAATVSGVAISIDSSSVLTTTQGDRATYFWNTANLSGPHTAGCTTSDGSASKTVVFGPTPAPTFSPSPSPTVTPTSTPTPSPSPVASPAISGTTYYVDPVSGLDTNSGTTTAAPWQHLSKVKSHGLSPGDGALLKAGTTTNEMLDVGGFQGTSGHQIVFSSYGAGAQPTMDELNANNFCMFYDPSYGTSTPAKYVTIDNIKCIHAIKSGIKFDVGGGVSSPGIIVQRSTIQDNGQGCSTVTGACLGTDDLGYNNCLDFQDSNVQPDGVQFLYNTVKWCGGHNLVQVHYDTGAVVERGNTVGPGGVHGYIDVKGIGSPSTPALIESNVIIGGAVEGLDSGAALLYTEDTADISSIIWRFNVGYDSQNNMFQFCPGACNHGRTCQIVGKFYNNTMYVDPSHLSSTTAIYSGSNCNTGCGTTPCDGTYLQSSLDVENNIFDGGDFEWSDGMACTEHNNSIGGSQHHAGLNICGSSGTGSGDQLNVDPLYTNASAADFTLKTGSPAINAGNPGITGSLNMGAY